MHINDKAVMHIGALKSFKRLILRYRMPALVASIAANYVGVFTLFCGYAVLAGIAALIALLSCTLHSANRPEPSKPT
ncbi:hypothetical protein CWC31_08165 [Pseudoalteromonas ruthenica]|uniref:hypothetical protein n=1 Tax=Pseudoalteromonas ruthenica TaxID=151081 RepID=UPI00127EBF1D|nr:hypothetical protein [Pseudoalteromonas ruthenica]TLX50950.1 hypothetical protein CWC31_08165 [Pseudoalteromonas ruthenica]